MLFSVLCTMLLGLCIMKREGRRVMMSLWRIVPCHCSARSGFPRLKPARVAFAPFARQKAFSFADRYESVAARSPTKLGGIIEGTRAVMENKVRTPGGQIYTLPERWQIEPR